MRPVHRAERCACAGPTLCALTPGMPSITPCDAGIEAAAAAGMRVVAVPSMLSQDGTLPHVYPSPDPGAAAGCVSLLPSLFDLRPEAYGLAAFDDILAGGAVPMDVVWRIKGTVVKGFGRGSRWACSAFSPVQCTSLSSVLL